MANRNHNQRRQKPAAQRPKAGRAAADFAGRRQEHPGKAARAAHPRRRRRRRGNMILYYLLLLVVMISVAVTLSLTVFFGIEQVTVTGADRYPQQDLVQATGVALGDNLFRIDKQQIIQNLIKFPYIEEVRVSRAYPPAVVAQVVQAQPVAAVKTGESCLLLSDKGRILETGLAEPPEGVLAVTGFAVAGLPGEFVPQEHQENLMMIRYLLKAIEETGFEGVRELDLSDRLNMKVNYEDRIQLELGSEGELDYKLRFAQSVIEQQLEPDFEGIVDVSDPGKAWTRHTGADRLFEWNLNI